MISLRNSAGTGTGVLQTIAALLGAGFFGLAALGAATDTTIGPLQRLAAAASMAGVALLLAWVFYVAIRMVTAGTPTVNLGADHMSIRHPGLFRREIEIPRSSIVAVDVDVGTEGGLRPRDRFAIEASDEIDPGSVPKWLYSAKHGSPLPVIGHFREVPNVAVVLAQPFRFRGIRRVSRPLFRFTVRSPIRTKDAPGFLLPAQQPFIAEQQLRAWGAEVRRVTAAEALGLLPGDRARSREHYRTIATVGIGILVYAVYLAYTLMSGREGSPP